MTHCIPSLAAALASAAIACASASAPAAAAATSTTLPLSGEYLVRFEASYAVPATSLTLEGRPWPAEDMPTPYSRIPARYLPGVTTTVRHLSGNTAGLAVRFRTDATTIAAVWDGQSGFTMNHMADTGISGLDLYVRDPQATGRRAWKYAGTGRPDTVATYGTIARGLPGTMREYLLYLPLYNRVSELQICVPPGAAVEPAPPRARKPIVFYGTSITQGGCASRAGMAHPAILGRWLGRESVNLGFSGSGKMEPVMADVLAEIDAAAYILECLPNMTIELVSERVVPFVEQLRRARPGVPILLAENPNLAGDHAQNAALRRALAELRRRGHRHLHHLPAAPQLAGTEDGTVDGTHPTDLGYLRIAESYEPTLKRMLDGRR